MVRKLEAAPPPTSTGPLTGPPTLRSRAEAMHGLGIGTTRDMKSVVTGVFLPSWFGQTHCGKRSISGGKRFSSTMLRDTVFAVDLTVEVPELRTHIPQLTTCSRPNV